MIACEEKNPTKFEEIVNDYDKIFFLDKLQSYLIFHIKNTYYKIE